MILSEKVKCCIIVMSFKLFFAQDISGQRISGTIVNSEGNRIEFSTLSLYKNSTLVKSQMTDSIGKFDLTNIPKGNLLLRIVSLGYTTKNILLNVLKDTTINIILSSTTHNNLKSVEVKSKKPLIERKIDRLVFNVDNSIVSNGVDLLEALRQTPTVKVDDNNNISLIGKSNVSVMIDGRLLNLSGVNLINYLKSFRSDDISKIEVITTPPSMYEAAGNSGLINIVLKKNQSMGWSGNVSASYGQTTFPSYSDNIGINFQSKKLSATFRFRQYHGMQRSIENIDLIGDTSILSDTKRNDITYGIGAGANIRYKLNAKSEIGIIYDISRNNFNMDINNSSIYKVNNTIDSILYTPSTQKNSTNTQTLNTYYEIQFDTTGKKVDFGFNYFLNTPITTSNFETFTTTSQTNPEIVRNSSDMNYSVWNGQIDLSLPVKWSNIETGIKYTRFNNNSNIKYLNYKDNVYLIDSTKSNNFIYKEGNFASYFSITKVFNKKWTSKAGLRYEYTTTSGYSVNNSEINKKNYGNLFPTFYLQYKYNSNNIFNINYSRRINRPTFTQLNPFKWYSNPYIFSSGNPLLRPSINDNIEFSYLYKSILSVTLYAQKTNNGFGRVVQLIDNIKEVNYKNYLTQYYTGLEADLNLSPFNWWTTYFNSVFYYSKSNSSIADVLPMSGFSLSYSSNNSFILNKEQTFLFLINLWQSLPSKDANTYSKTLTNLSLGFKILLLDKKFSINVAGNDILKTSVSKGTIYFNQFVQRYDNYYDNRKLTISLSYSFGKKKLGGSTKQIKFEEKARGN